MSSKKDDIYANPLHSIVDFQFDEKVVNVFADMINRSVPGYSTLIKCLGLLAAQHAQPESRCYDLGCSLGAVTLSMMQQINESTVDFVAIDNSTAMIKRCQQHLSQAQRPERAELICADIRDSSIHQASVVVMNFTLQFVPLEDRATLINNIYQGLMPGGALLLSEKIALSEESADEQMIDWYHAFKRANGYSEMEVSQKRTALENVLIPETLQAHEQRLKAAGFSRVYPWFQCFNFVSLVAVK